MPNDDLAELATGRKIERRFFSAIIRKQTVWGNIIQPIAGRLGSNLRPEGWRIAAYKRTTSAEQGAWDVHFPVVVKIAAVNIYARDVDVEEFVSRLRSYQFADVFLGDRIVEELPPYVSGKLSELIDANSLFWRKADRIDAPERERRRGEVLKYFKEDFLELCDKKTSPTSLLKFAASACDPTLVPPSQRLLSTSVTPTMLALLTAAKLYWSAHCKYGQTRETYPDQEALLSFLRFMGLQEGNTAASGRTLIRPEGIPTPEPQKEWLTTVKLKRQWLGR